MAEQGRTNLRPRRGESSYRLLARILREQIYNNAYADDQPLPTESELVDAHGLSRQTVRRAYQELVADGLVYRERGRGTFIVPSDQRYGRPFASVGDLMGLTLDTEFEVIKPLHGGWDEDAAEKLHLRSRQLYSIVFRRIHHDSVFCMTTVYLPPDVGAQLEELPELSIAGARSRVTVIALIESRGHDIVGADQVITAVAATDRVAELLGCAAGIPILHVERTYFGRNGQPLEHAVSDFLPEQYSHRLRLGRGRQHGH